MTTQQFINDVTELEEKKNLITQLQNEIRGKELEMRKRHIEIVKDLKSKAVVKRTDGAVAEINKKTLSNYDRYITIDGQRYMERKSVRDLIEEFALGQEGTWREYDK